MGAQDDLWEFPKRTRHRERLHLEDIERRCRQPAISKGIDERCFIDELAARRIDQPCALLHQSKFALSEHVPIVSRQRTVQRYEIGLAKQLLERNRPDSHGSAGVRLALRHVVAEREEPQVGWFVRLARIAADGTIAGDIRTGVTDLSGRVSLGAMGSIERRAGEQLAVLVAAPWE